MPWIAGRHGKRWTADEEAKLREMAASGSWLCHIARSLDRYPEAVQQHAGKIGVALRWHIERPKGSIRFEFAGLPNGKPKVTVWAETAEQAESFAIAEAAARAEKLGQSVPLELRLVSMALRGVEFQ